MFPGYMCILLYCKTCLVQGSYIYLWPNVQGVGMSILGISAFFYMYQQDSCVVVFHRSIGQFEGSRSLLGICAFFYM